MSELGSNPNLSLREKWRIHMEKKKKQQSKFLNNPVFLHKGGPFVFLFIFTGVGGWGALVAVPTLYRGGWEDYVWPCQVVVLLCMVEVMLNWCMIRWVDSAYRPHIHGTKPPDAPHHLDATITVDTTRPDACPPDNGARPDEGDGSVYKRGCSAHFPNGTPTSPSDGTDTSQSAPSAARGHSGSTYRMWVATSLPREDGHVERQPVPYWSWVQCFLCQRLRPPRCHHCIICGCCVLKRDHHCYMTGACIGLNNQRYFIVFLLWAALACVLATLHMLPYTFLHVLPEYHVRLLDFLPPVCLVRGLLGYVSPVVFPLCLEFWFLLYFTGFTVFNLGGYVYHLYLGRTIFEGQHRILVVDTRDLGGKLRSVFGERWWVNVLLPAWWTRPVEDAVLWPHIKP